MKTLLLLLALFLSFSPALAQSQGSKATNSKKAEDQKAQEQKEKQQKEGQKEASDWVKGKQKKQRKRENGKAKTEGRKNG